MRGQIQVIRDSSSRSPINSLRGGGLYQNIIIISPHRKSQGLKQVHICICVGTHKIYITCICHDCAMVGETKHLKVIESVLHSFPFSLLPVSVIF
jgi:hypothetical protein